jgi:hypothetical protein
MKDIRRVEVTWIDPTSDMNNTWQYIENMEPLELFVVNSMGYILEDDDAHILLVSHLAPNAVSGRMWIPRGCILNIEELGTTQWHNQ